MRKPNAGEVLARYAGFEGGIEEFAVTADAILAEIGVDDETATSVRVIRDYAQRGIVSRPERQGRESVYEYRQLIEFIAARVLVRDGWPLAKIAEHFARLTLEDLSALVPGSRPATSALNVVRSLMSETEGRKALLKSRRQAPVRSMPPQSNLAEPEPGLLFGAMSAQLSRSKAELPSLLAMLGADPAGPEARDVTILSIAPWLHVAIDRARLSRITQEDAETIARTIAASLMKTAPRGGK